MTLSEIYAEAQALCPDLDAELDESFSTAVGRAMADIAAELKLEKVLRITANGQKPLTRVAKFDHRGGFCETLPLVGRAYSLWVAGTGSFKISDGGVTRRVDFATEGRLYRGFITGECEISFLGELDFTVTSLSCYGRVFSERIADIPDGSGRMSYDLRSMCADFGGVIDRPTDGHGREIEGARVSGDLLTVDEGFLGAIYLRYRVSPTPPHADEADAPLPLPESARRSLVLLTVAWLTVADDIERAEYFMSFYRDSIATEAGAMRQNLDTGYRVPNRWA